MTDFVKSKPVIYPYLIENPDCKDFVGAASVLWKIVGDSYLNIPHCPKCGCAMTAVADNFPFQCICPFISHISPLTVDKFMKELPPIKKPG